MIHSSAIASFFHPWGLESACSQIFDSHTRVVQHEGGFPEVVVLGRLLVIIEGYFRLDDTYPDPRSWWLSRLFSGS